MQKLFQWSSQEMAKEGHSPRRWISHSFHLHIATFFYCCTHTLSVLFSVFLAEKCLKPTCTLWQIPSLDVEMHDSSVMDPSASVLSVQCTETTQTLHVCVCVMKEGFATSMQLSIRCVLHSEQPAGEPGMWWKVLIEAVEEFSPPSFNTINGNAVRVGQNAT